MNKIFLGVSLIALFSCNKEAKERAEQRIHDSVAVVYKAYVDSATIARRHSDSIIKAEKKSFQQHPGIMSCENGTMSYTGTRSRSKNKSKQ